MVVSNSTKVVWLFKHKFLYLFVQHLAKDSHWDSHRSNEFKMGLLVTDLLILKLIYPVGDIFLLVFMRDKEH